jgi:hypothetical protein
VAPALRRSDTIKDRVLAREAIAVGPRENDNRVRHGGQEQREDIARKFESGKLIGHPERPWTIFRSASKVCAREVGGPGADYRLKKSAYEDIKGRSEILNLRRIDDDRPFRRPPHAWSSQESGTGTGRSNIEHQVEIDFWRPPMPAAEGGGP